ncbi:GNAT family N-acetyltransferase [archaeon]|jgi:GNAT superfamily N-acetyltransferase|nr:GNAT family N-acetyltransferase [archaeon]MBT7128890.1 GNAT family N-acetyltransferase [archaeon]
MVNDNIRLIEDEESKRKLAEMYSLFYRETEADGDFCLDDKEAIDTMVSSIGNSQNKWGYFVDNSRGDPVGFILCHRYTNAASSYIKPGDVEIESFVERGERGKGLGKLLKNAATDSIAEMAKGPARVLSFVESTNETNLAVLRKTGFSEIKGSGYTGDPGRMYSIYARDID